MSSDNDPIDEGPLVPASLAAVDRAIADLRRGAMVLVRGPERRAVLVQAAEMVSEHSLLRLRAVAGSAPVVAVTGRRAQILGLLDTDAAVVRMSLADGADTSVIRHLVDPTVEQPDRAPVAIGLSPAERRGCETAAVELARLAKLLPAAVCADLPKARARYLPEWAASQDVLVVDVDDIFAYPRVAATSLKRAGEARVPLEGAVESRIIAFRPIDGGIEHFAVLVGKPDASAPVLTRIHSECFTGDLLGSLRCDCGDQLRGAIAEIGANGAGVLLYLSQEGRGIGLVNKLRAYALQDRGADTLDANLQLGFDADERIYLPAAEMLRQLGFDRVRLMTNNPAKVAALEACGVAVAERVAHRVASNRHNEAYLRTKARRFGHFE